MPWHTDMTLLVRVLVDDLVSPHTYTDEKIQQLIVVAAQIIKIDVDFLYTYTTDVEGAIISPDPVDSNDNGFITLVGLKAACLILAGEAKLAASQSVKIQDAGAVIDLGNTYKAKKELYDQLCADFARAKVSYLAGNLNAFHAVLSPYTQETNPAGIFFG